MVSVKCADIYIYIVSLYIYSKIIIIAIILILILLSYLSICKTIDLFATVLSQNVDTTTNRTIFKVS